MKLNDVIIRKVAFGDRITPNLIIELDVTIFSQNDQDIANIIKTQRGGYINDGKFQRYNITIEPGEIK